MVHFPGQIALRSMPAKAKPFYAELMGWEIEDVPMGEGMFYTMYKSDGEHVAGLSQMQPEMQSQGMPSHWSSYVTVDDVDALAGKVTELGGTVISEPFDVFDSGRMMVLQDPTGAIVCLWQAKNHIGSGLVNTPGAMTWNELTTNDPKKRWTSMAHCSAGHSRKWKVWIIILPSIMGV